jgi:hypothetical protein
MATSTSATLSRANVAQLGGLIVACNDDARAQTAAASCTRIASKTERLYERAASARMPKSVRDVIARHDVEVAADRAELRRSSMGG